MSRKPKDDRGLILELACNDPDNGHFTGLFDFAEVAPRDGEPLIHVYGTETRVSELPGRRLRAIGPGRSRAPCSHPGRRGRGSSQRLSLHAGLDALAISHGTPRNRDHEDFGA